MKAFLLPILLLVLGLSPAWSRDAADFFHAAAQRYVEGKVPEALLEAEEGLRRHPGDERLQSLARHLREERERQRQEGNGNAPRPDESGERSDGRDPGRQDQDKPQPDRQEPPRGDDSGPRDEEGGNRKPQPAPRPGEMSREDAERLLNSFADDEKQEQAGRRRAVAPAPGMEQTW